MTIQLQAGRGQIAGAGRHHAPARLWDGSDQVRRAGHDGDTFLVVGFALFQFRDFGDRIQVWCQGSYDFDGANAVRDLDDPLGIDIVFLSPLAPLPSNRASRVDQNSVQIEENSGAFKRFHGWLNFLCELGGFSLRALRSRASKPCHPERRSRRTSIIYTFSL